MIPTTQITTLDLDLTAVAGEFVADYDWDVVRRSYADALAEASGVPTLTIALDGSVYVEIDHADEAREVDWVDLDVDAGALLEAAELDHVRQPPRA